MSPRTMTSTGQRGRRTGGRPARAREVKPRTITVRALRVIQMDGVPLYSFFMRGGDLLKLADLARLHRDDGGALRGFQRGEVRKHVNEIQRYLDSKQVLFPNGVIIAISQDVPFKLSRGPKGEGGIGEAGHLELPLAGSDDAPRVAWVVDGQQRSLALSRCNKPDLPVPVCAFVTTDLDLQRDQFVRINQGRPLPKNLVDELLPEYDAVLPTHLSARKIPSELVDYLNKHPDSPFRGLVKRPSNFKRKKGEAGVEPVIKDTVLLEAIKRSLQAEHGCLAHHRDPLTGRINPEGVHDIARTLMVYWTAVKATFPHAWGLPPTKSRLMHAAGLRAMSALMDPIMLSVDLGKRGVEKDVAKHLALVAPHCAWTAADGDWADGYPWNYFQALSGHIKALTGHVLNRYYEARGALSA